MRLPWYFRPWSAVRALRVEVALRDASLADALMRIDDLGGVTPPAVAPRVVLMRRWRLRPWKQATVLAGNLDACRLAIERQGVLIATVREQAEQMRREAAAASGGGPLARSVGWEQPAGAVAPQLAVLVFGRGGSPGLRVYASRDLAGSVIETAGEGAAAAWRAHLIMSRLLVLNSPDFPAALADMARVWTAAPPAG